MQLDAALHGYEVQLAGDGRSEHTIRQVRRHVRAFADWLATQEHSCAVDEITHEQVARYLASDAVRMRSDGGPRKASSANAIRSSLRAFFGFVHGAGYAPTNAARLVRRANTRAPGPKALTDGDAAKLLAVLAEATTPIEVRDRALFTVMLRCGLRLGSALGLDIGDVDFGAGELVLRSIKGGGETTVVLPSDVAELLRAFIGGRTSGPVFTSSGCERICSRHARRRLAEWSSRAGLASIHPHALRHTFGQRLYLRTRDVVLVASAMTHRSISSSQVYVRADREAVRAALA
jgi:integrase/recombinase XerC